MYIGLCAEYYDKLITVDDDEREFYAHFLRQSPGRALELGCGTGQLLGEYVRQGFIVDGLDSSTDMLEQCARKIVGFPVILYEQSIEQLQLSQKYQTIYAPAMVFMHIDPEKVLVVLRRLREQLLPGGQILLSWFIPLQEAARVSQNTWHIYQTCEQLTWWQSLSYDFDAHVRTVQYRFELGDTVETYTMTWHWYSIEEMQRLLQQAGFSQAAFYGDYALEYASDEHEIIIAHALC